MLDDHRRRVELMRARAYEMRSMAIAMFAIIIIIALPVFGVLVWLVLRW